MKKSALNLVEKGIPVNLSHPLFLGTLRTEEIQRTFKITLTSLQI